MGEYAMQYKILALASLLAIPLFAAPSPARADFCIQVSGGPFSGDLGFFRFRGDLPVAPGTIRALRGRVAGMSPVFGTATVTKDGKALEIGATFFADAEQGQIDIGFAPPRARAGDGNGDYGAFGTGQSLTATKVRCSSEP
jgi:hypothetical protein